MNIGVTLSAPALSKNTADRRHMTPEPMPGQQRRSSRASSSNGIAQGRTEISFPCALCIAVPPTLLRSFAQSACRFRADQAAMRPALLVFGKTLSAALLQTKEDS